MKDKKWIRYSFKVINNLNKVIMGYYNDNNRNQIANFSEIITKYIGNINNGFVVDVGAHDGYKWSNRWP